MLKASHWLVWQRDRQEAVSRCTVVAIKTLKTETVAHISTNKRPELNGHKSSLVPFSERMLQPEGLTPTAINKAPSSVVWCLQWVHYPGWMLGSFWWLPLLTASLTALLGDQVVCQRRFSPAFYSISALNLLICASFWVVVVVVDEKTEPLPRPI